MPSYEIESPSLTEAPLNPAARQDAASGLKDSEELTDHAPRRSTSWASIAEHQRGLARGVYEAAPSPVEVPPSPVEAPSAAEIAHAAGAAEISAPASGLDDHYRSVSIAPASASGVDAVTSETSEASQSQGTFSEADSGGMASPRVESLSGAEFAPESESARPEMPMASAVAEAPAAPATRSAGRIDDSHLPYPPPSILQNVTSRKDAAGVKVSRLARGRVKAGKAGSLASGQPGEITELASFEERVSGPLARAKPEEVAARAPRAPRPQRPRFDDRALADAAGDRALASGDGDFDPVAREVAAVSAEPRPLREARGPRPDRGPRPERAEPGDRAKRDFDGPRGPRRERFADQAEPGRERAVANWSPQRREVVDAAPEAPKGFLAKLLGGLKGLFGKKTAAGKATPAAKKSPVGQASAGKGRAGGPAVTATGQPLKVRRDATGKPLPYAAQPVAEGLAKSPRVAESRPPRLGTPMTAVDSATGEAGGEDAKPKRRRRGRRGGRNRKPDGAEGAGAGGETAGAAHRED